MQSSPHNLRAAPAPGAISHFAGYLLREIYLFCILASFIDEELNVSKKDRALIINSSKSGCLQKNIALSVGQVEDFCQTEN